MEQATPVTATATSLSPEMSEWVDHVAHDVVKHFVNSSGVENSDIVSSLSEEAGAAPTTTVAPEVGPLIGMSEKIISKALEENGWISSAEIDDYPSTKPDFDPERMIPDIWPYIEDDGMPFYRRDVSNDVAAATTPAPSEPSTATPEITAKPAVNLTEVAVAVMQAMTHHDNATTTAADDEEMDDDFESPEQAATATEGPEPTTTWWGGVWTTPSEELSTPSTVYVHTTPTLTMQWWHEDGTTDDEKARRTPAVKPLRDQWEPMLHSEDDFEPLIHYRSVDNDAEAGRVDASAELNAKVSTAAQNLKDHLYAFNAAFEDDAVANPAHRLSPETLHTVKSAAREIFLHGLHTVENSEEGFAAVVHKMVGPVPTSGVFSPEFYERLPKTLVHDVMSEVTAAWPHKVVERDVMEDAASEPSQADKTKASIADHIPPEMKYMIIWRCAATPPQDRPSWCAQVLDVEDDKPRILTPDQATWVQGPPRILTPDQATRWHEGDELEKRGHGAEKGAGGALAAAIAIIAIGCL